MTAARARLLGVATILGTLFGWSSIPLFQRHFSADIDAWTSNGWRYGFSALLWAPAVFVARRRGTLPAGIWRTALLPSLFNVAGQAGFAWTFYLVDPALGTFGLRLQIVFLTVGAAVFFEAERRLIRRPLFLLGLGLVVAGTLATLGLGVGFGGRASPLGVAVAVVAGALFAGYGLSVRHFLRGVDPLVGFAVISLETTLGCVALMVFLGAHAGGDVALMSGRNLGLLALSSVVGIGLGHTFYYIAIARLGVAVSGAIIQVQPFLVGAASLLLFGERLSALQWAAGGVAILGAALVLRAEASGQGAPEPM